MQYVAKDHEGKYWRCNLFDADARADQRVTVEICGAEGRTLTVKRSELQEFNGQMVENPRPKIR